MLNDLLDICAHCGRIRTIFDTTRLICRDCFRLLNHHSRPMTQEEVCHEENRLSDLRQYCRS